MRYIAKIFDAGGEEHGYAWMAKPANCSRVVIRDTDGASFEVLYQDIPDEIFGRGSREGIDCLVATKPHHLGLLKHIKYMRITDKTRCGKSVFYDGSVSIDNPDIPSVYVSTRSGAVTPVTLDGGVLYINLYVFGGLYNIYDTLAWACRECKHNLMQYPELCFSVSVRNQYFRVGLSQDIEAKRYYSKMWMDIMR